MRKFSFLKNLKKGIEGAIIAGGAGEAVIRVLEHAEDVDVQDIEHAVTVLLAASAGFIFRSIRNWLKNREQ